MKKLALLLVLICTSFAQRKYKYSNKTYPLSELIKFDIKLLKIEESSRLVDLIPFTTEKAYKIYIKLNITNISNFSFKMFSDNFILCPDKDIAICYDCIKTSGGEPPLVFENSLYRYKYKPLETKIALYSFMVCKQSNFKFKIKFYEVINKKYGNKILSNPKDVIYSNEIDINMLE